MTTPGDERSTVILVNHDGMGSATAPLQHQLLKTYLSKLLENGMLPEAICFYTEGVKMVVEGTPVLRELKALVERGVRIIICDTCLRYYDLAGKEAVGTVGGMAEILEAQWQADKVITL